MKDSIKVFFEVNCRYPQLLYYSQKIEINGESTESLTISKRFHNKLQSIYNL